MKLSTIYVKRFRGGPRRGVEEVEAHDDAGRVFAFLLDRIVGVQKFHLNDK